MRNKLSIELLSGNFEYRYANHGIIGIRDEEDWENFKEVMKKNYDFNNNVNKERIEIFENIELIAEEGFNKIYKAIWIDGPISKWNKKQQRYNRLAEIVVALKVINNSKIITNKDLNELKVFYRFAISSLNRTCVNEYYGITYDPITQNYMIITKYYNGGNLTHYIANNFFNMDWNNKLSKSHNIIDGLHSLHMVNIMHKNYHSGNTFLSNKAVIANDDDDEVYGIIPYIAPEIFQGQKYTKASDIYSFGMIMWELMTGKKPFGIKIMI
ncbi:kinase-like domain-containing protein [Rhizophagus diaphanus]|nr:kinase-like domain-containing protein [Rhizophagus diaphanus] [Rhizophagus sp. MUCL 43196]